MICVIKGRQKRSRQRGTQRRAAPVIPLPELTSGCDKVPPISIVRRLQPFFTLSAPILKEVADAKQVKELIQLERLAGQRVNGARLTPTLPIPRSTARLRQALL